VRNPISVGIDPVRSLKAVVFCGVGNTIEVVSIIVSVKDENWQSSQSFKTARLGTRYCTTLTKVKQSQACKRSDLSWNRPSKVVESCSILWCWKYDRGGKQCSISVRNENWQSSQSI